MVLTNQPGAKSWPITGATFILMHTTQRDPGKARTALKFFDWCYKHGARAALDLHYVPLPEKVVKMVEGEWRKSLKDASGHPILK